MVTRCNTSGNLPVNIFVYALEVCQWGHHILTLINFWTWWTFRLLIPMIYEPSDLWIPYFMNLQTFEFPDLWTSRPLNSLIYEPPALWIPWFMKLQTYESPDLCTLRLWIPWFMNLHTFESPDLWPFSSLNPLNYDQWTLRTATWHKHFSVSSALFSDP